MTELVSYRRVDSTGKGFRLYLMKALTRVIGPVGRVRGLGFVARWFGSSDELTKVYLNNNAVFSFPVFDPYWSYYLFLKKSFEVRLEGFLRQISQQEFTFIDCGANFGYWSVLLSSEPWGAHFCVAIEASNETYPLLRRTSAFNDSRIECMKYAVYSSSGEELSFTEGARHAGRHIVNGEIETLDVNKVRMFTPKERIASIKTISIDDVISNIDDPGCSLLVKLDVEGAEINALKGADRVANGDTVFVYEDFGSDQSVTEYMLGDGYQVYRPQRDGSLYQILSVKDAKELKASDSKDDHNYVAFKGNGRLISAVRKLADLQ